MFMHDKYFVPLNYCIICTDPGFFVTNGSLISKKQVLCVSQSPLKSIFFCLRGLLVLPGTHIYLQANATAKQDSKDAKTPVGVNAVIIVCTCSQRGKKYLAVTDSAGCPT